MRPFKPTPIYCAPHEGPDLQRSKVARGWKSFENIRLEGYVPLYRAEKYCLECKSFKLMVKIQGDEWMCKTCYTFGDGQHPLDKQHVAPPVERLGPKQPGFKKSLHRTRVWATCVGSRSAKAMRYRKRPL